jgi:deazaflavin-dependent oxidoreductase (nitroreductase family)
MTEAALPDDVRQALATDRIIDITTTGRQTGQARRLETWLYRAGGKYYLTGRPGRRGWLANIAANPALTVHIKTSATADLPATGRVIGDEAARRAILTEILGELRARVEASGGDTAPYDVEAWVARAPLVEVTLA